MPPARTLPRASAGIGFRSEIAADLLRAPEGVDFVEVVAEACFASPAARREAVAVSRIWPVVPHGVKLSLGSAEGVDLDRARRLGALARELGAPVVTEHVAFVRAGGREIGHLTQVPFTRASARVVARNVAAARRLLPDVPLLLENAAWTLQWPGDELDEAAFYGEIVEQTGCDLLLDLGNLHANALNAGRDPAAVLDAYPLERVAMVHIAGGTLQDGFYLDTHAHAVPDPVFALLERLVARIGPVPVVLERDDGFPAFHVLAAEVARARGVLDAPRRPHPPTPLSLKGEGGSEGAAPPSPFRERGAGGVRSAHDDLIDAQARLAALLTDPAPPSAEAAAPFGERALLRSRGVLQDKRVDDALPLLQRLLPHREVVRPLAAACVGASPRAPSLAGVADAMRIAGEAARDPRLAAQARVDLLLLRCRFVGPANDGSLRPRIAPFAGRERLPDGRVVWAFKGPGGNAPTWIYEPRR